MPFESRDIRNDTENDVGAISWGNIDIVKNTINKANTANLLNVVMKYGIHIDQNNNICCPFHKNGQERSASFYLYPETNSYYCFGCKIYGKPVDFVACIENISKYEAASIILNGFDTGVVNLTEKKDYFYKIYLDFSHSIRDFIIRNKYDEKALGYAENITIAFDNIRNKYSLEIDGLNTVISNLKRKLESFEANSNFR